MKAKFITLDGIDGAGKSTNLDTIRSWFEKHQLPVLFTREPGGTAIGEALRKLLLDPATHANARTETLMIFAARQQHLDEVIKPALAQGIHVVSDRFTDATFAYQGGGRGLPLADIAILENWVQQGLQPDLTLLLDVPLTVAQQRLSQNSNPDRFEQLDTAFFEHTRTVYLDRAAAVPQRYAIVDSSLNLSEVAQQLNQALVQLFGLNS
ncbi:dTMP kinase [Snodgrassella alvi]|uniref:Thymidylate kinase n=1 Tax=Snodgrassella alvi TaxID=1196083 RepID=A0A2N9WU26_9NEIS|nr:dTMP kinase [Snodgrassella alvi]PIT15180.1 dTMP kinase [Snodgrassella alvi]PIT15441.1 dTMP kinase [Snodgrassella alvi]PIT21475.1 dTMP kinase [Snodgrassella alvi]